ncbi:hypothetical protein AB0I81_22450 [Nonomuraea sp. NPDC050404]|uniref:hypothetical protein n=1 Tax=Nonomuraea sp. NPDC050404 TaxID=3155783 RepID=UPI00341068BD
MDQPIALPLTGHTYHSITPDQVNHKLTDDGWSSFDYGPLRVSVRAADLTKIRAARQLAAKISAAAGFWDGDLKILEERLTAEENERIADPPAPEPTLAEQIAAPDPAMDRSVARVADLAEAHRDPEEEGDL